MATFQDLSRVADAFLGVGVERAGSDVGQILHLDPHRFVSEEHDIQRILLVSSQDQLREGKRDLLGGSDPIFTIENHAVGNVDQDDRGARGRMLRFRHR